jgi:hypothetical protein
MDFSHGNLQTDGNTKTISVEEMAVITKDGAEYMQKPQSELILIHPK